MRTWNDYKEHVKSVDPEIGKDMDEVENISGVLMFHGDHEINDIKIMLHKDGYRGSYGVTKKKFHKNVAPENNGISDVNKEEE